MTFKVKSKSHNFQGVYLINGGCYDQSVHETQYTVHIMTWVYLIRDNIGLMTFQFAAWPLLIELYLIYHALRCIS